MGVADRLEVCLGLQMRSGTDLVGLVVACYGLDGGLGEVFRRVEEGFVVVVVVV